MNLKKNICTHHYIAEECSIGLIIPYFNKIILSDGYYRIVKIRLFILVLNNWTQNSTFIQFVNM